MKTRTKPILLALVGALILAVITLMAFIYGRTTPFTPLPNPNGYDDFVQAGALLSGKIDDYRNLSHEELKVLVATNANTLALVRTGLKKQCALPMQNYLMNSAAMSTDVPPLKQTAQLLAAAS